MLTWDAWKKGFDIWEEHTAQLVETFVRSPAVLGPAGQLMSGVMRAKVQHDKAVAQAWSQLGLPTRRDQERTLYTLQQLQSKLTDLEEQLSEARAAVARLQVSPAQVQQPAVTATPTPARGRQPKTPA